MISTEQIKAARMLLRWDQADLAKQAQVAISTVKRIEARPGRIQSNTNTAWLLQQAFEQAGIEFIDASEDKGPGVRLAKP
jgi:DNA-binding XRE family transcriptional regulator